MGYLGADCYLPPHAGGGTYFGVPPKKQNALYFAYYSSGTAATRDTVHTHLFGRANLRGKFAYVPRLQVRLCTDLLSPLAADLAPSLRELAAKQTEGVSRKIVDGFMSCLKRDFSFYVPRLQVRLCTDCFVSG